MGVKGICIFKVEEEKMKEGFRYWEGFIWRKIEEEMKFKLYGKREIKS